MTAPDERSPRPEPLDVRADQVPARLREYAQWVCWRYEWNPDRETWTKVPVDATTDRNAKTNDPATWASFGTALAHHENPDTETDGVGFVLHEDDPFVGLDLDDIRDPEAGTVTDWATDMCETMETYAEVSPSGTGLHVIAEGTLADGRRRGDVPEAPGHLEMYDSGRYLTVTGDHLSDTSTDVQAVPEALSNVHTEYLAVATVDDTTRQAEREPSAAGDSLAVDVDDAELLERARHAANGEGFRRLFDDGKYGHHPSQSEADLELCSRLAFWAGRDADRIDRLFRRSALMRGKWNEVHFADDRTYGEATIEKALDGQDEVYTPGGGAEATTSVHTVDGGAEGAFSGPPEPVVGDDGSVAVVQPTTDGRGLDRLSLDVWRCTSCGATTRAPVTPGDTLDAPAGCSACEEGALTLVGLSEAEAQTAVDAATIWQPARGITEADIGDVWDDVRSYICDHWDTDTEGVYEALTAFVLSTWFRENMTFIPHLLLMGKTTDGKTRLLNTLGQVSYRALVVASATPASMFRLIDEYGVSYFISEYHGLDREVQRELDNVIRAGQKRGEKITRAEQTATGYEPTVFDPFAHVAVATQYEPDDDIVNRCLQVRSSSARRAMPPELDEPRASVLRDQLLYARFRLLDSEAWATAETAAYDYLHARGIDGRTREKLLGLVTVAVIGDRLERIEAFVDTVVDQDRDAAADSEDARFVEAVRDLAFEAAATFPDSGSIQVSSIDIPYGDVVARYEAMTGIERSASWVGHAVKRNGLEKERLRDGTVIRDPDLGTKLQALCKDLGLDWEEAEVHTPVRELPTEEHSFGVCPECGTTRTLTHRDVAGDGNRICDECVADVQAASSRDRVRAESDAEEADS